MYFKKLVEQYTGGQIKVDIFPAGTLLSAAQSLQGVVTGSVDVSFDPPFFSTSVVPHLQSVYIGGIWTGVDHADRVFESDLWVKKATDLFSAKGVQYLGMLHEAMFTGYTNNKVKATDMADFKGLKFALRAGSAANPLHEYAGFAQISISAADIVTALQQRMLDVDGTGLTTLMGQKRYEFARYVLMVPLGPMASMVIMNKPKFDGLPKEYKDLMQNKIMPEVYDYARSLMIENEDKLMTLAKQKFEFVYINNDEDMIRYYNAFKDYGSFKKAVDLAPDIYEMIAARQKA